MNNSIAFFDLAKQNELLKEEIQLAIETVLKSGQFIKGKEIAEFESQLATYLNVKHVISCGNGTDALQIALMALQLKPGDEVIVPAFTYIASVEVITLLGLIPVLADIELDTFNLSIESLLACISSKTKAIMPVHLFGQCANMEAIIEIAKNHKIAIVEDAAQALGSEFKFSNGQSKFAGCMGEIGTTSFFPTKNLSCFGDGGAIFTNNDELAQRIKMIANHGQVQQYRHEIIGVNSRLDTLQAAILKIKLNHLKKFESQRIAHANWYFNNLNELKYCVLPQQASNSTHVYNQFTLRILSGKRDEVKSFLMANGIPSMVYYPKPVNEQNAYKNNCMMRTSLVHSIQACQEVLSIPIYPELTISELNLIAEKLKLALS